MLASLNGAKVSYCLEYLMVKPMIILPLCRRGLLIMLPSLYRAKELYGLDVAMD